MEHNSVGNYELVLNLTAFYLHKKGSHGSSRSGCSGLGVSRPDSRSDPIGESEPVSGCETIYLGLFTCFFFFRA